MNLLRHILSHLLLFFILMAIGLSYYFRPVIFPVAVNDKITHLVNSVYPPALKVVYVAPEQKQAAIDVAPQSVRKNEPENVVVAETAVKAEAAVPVIEEQQVVVLSEQNIDTDVASAEQENIDTTDAEQKVVEVEEAPAVEKDEKTGQVTVSTLSTAKVAPEETTAVVTDSETGAEQQLLNDARRAYQQQDLATAITKYRQLIALDEHSPNAFGELGNIYYLQGKWQEAGAAYYEAAVRLVENGQMQQVAYLHRVIQGLDRSKADQLAVKINHGRM